MATKTRKRAKSTEPAPASLIPVAPCCKPYPDARWRDETLYRVDMHHNGQTCAGRLDPVPRDRWAEVVSYE